MRVYNAVCGGLRISCRCLVCRYAILQGLVLILAFWSGQQIHDLPVLSPSIAIVYATGTSLWSL